MKAHTTNYKNAIATGGREIKSKISYMLNNEEILISDDDIFSIKYITDGSILKSVMKSVELTVKNNIPLETILHCEFGLKINGEYEFLDFGNYVVFSSDKQEDLNNYKIVCYDKMLYSMVEYEELNVTYPITVRNYLNAICQKLGLTFASVNNTFANYNRQINIDLYKDLGYTFRDVLDELAEVTASTICINNNDALEVRYINNTNDTINEDYLKNINVNFGKKYGPVNSIVLSRSAESDNVYIQDAESIAQYGLCEIKIKDNQIMNFNDRSEYLPDLLNKLDGLQYYLNDFSSPGITYYDLCDRYTVQIGETNYSCIMLNDEINITQGLEENIHTDLLETSETDYKKADKTDQRINQTYLIVDKQNQAIEGVISNVTEQNTKINNIQLTVDELNAKIQDIADITISGETSYATFTLDGVNESEPIQIKVRPITDNISYDYPHNDYPQLDYSKIRLIRFHNDTTNENIDYVLPDDLLYYDNTHYDEFYLDYDSHTCQITKRCKWNADGTIGLLTSEQVVSYEYPSILLEDGDYTLSLLGYTNGYLFMRLMAKNIYTSQFYTKVETDSRINATATSINLEVDQKLTNYDTVEDVNAKLSLKVGRNDNDQVVSMINASANDISMTGNRISIVSDNFSLSNDGEIVATAGDIGGFNMNSTSFKKNLNGIYNYSLEDVALAFNIVLGALKQNTNIDYILDYDNSGEVDLLDAQKILRILNGLDQNTRNVQGVFEINSNDLKNCLLFKNNNGQVSTSIGLGGINTEYIYTKNFACGKAYTSGTIFRGTTIDGETGQITIVGQNNVQTIIKAGEIVLSDGQGHTKTITATS